jgi:hypothetical protein
MSDSARSRLFTTLILISDFTLPTEGTVGHGSGQRGRGGTALFCCLWHVERQRRQPRRTAWGAPRGRVMDGLPLGAEEQPDTGSRAEEERRRADI